MCRVTLRCQESVAVRGSVASGPLCQHRTTGAEQPHFCTDLHWAQWSFCQQQARDHGHRHCLLVVVVVTYCSQPFVEIGCQLYCLIPAETFDLVIPEIVNCDWWTIYTVDRRRFRLWWANFFKNCNSQFQWNCSFWETFFRIAQKWSGVFQFLSRW